MTSSSGTDYSDLLRTAPSGRKVQKAIEKLTGYFDIDAIVVMEVYGKVECLSDESKVLEEVKEKFKEEFLESKEMLNIVRVMAPEKDETKKGKTKYYISRTIRLLAFQNGWSNLDKLGADDDCIILIPVAMTGSGAASVHDRTTKRETTFTFETGTEFITTGKCSILLREESKVVCVVLLIGQNKT